MNSSNGNFLDENGNPVNIVQLLKTGKAVPVENPGPGLHMAAHSGWFTDENGKPVNIVALIDAAIDEDGGSDEPAIGGISVNGGNVVTPDENGIINLTISGDGSTVIDSELSTSSTNPVQNKVVTGEIADLNDAVDLVKDSLKSQISIPIDLRSSSLWTLKKAIKEEDGGLSNFNYSAVSDYIPIPFNGSNVISYTGATADSNENPLSSYVGQYTNNKTFIKRSQLLNYGEPVDVVLDNACSFIRVTIARSSSTGITITTAALSLFGATITPEITGFLSNRLDVIEGYKSTLNLKNCGSFYVRTKLDATQGLTLNDASYITTDFIPVDFKKIYLNKGSRYHFYNDQKQSIYTNNISNVNPVYGDMKIISVPSNATYFRITITTDVWDSAYIYGSTMTDYVMDYIDNHDSTSKKVLYTMGDSITRGMYANIGSDSSTGPTTYCYAYWVAELNNYTLYNLGESGTGWVNETKNAVYVADNNDFADADYITLAFGVNDYKATAETPIGSLATSVLGDGSIIGNMRYVIETIITKAPQAKLFIISPLNGNRILGGVTSCVETDNWYMGTPVQGRTLKDVKDAIKSVAEYYGIELIDLQQVGPVNRKNIRTLLGDGLHPSLKGHEMIGRTLSAFIK